MPLLNSALLCIFDMYTYVQILNFPPVKLYNLKMKFIIIYSNELCSTKISLVKTMSCFKIIHIHTQFSNAFSLLKNDEFLCEFSG